MDTQQKTNEQSQQKLQELQQEYNYLMELYDKEKSLRKCAYDEMLEANLKLALAKNKILKSENMLQMVLDNFPGVVFWKDRQSIFLGCNQSCATIAGLNSPVEIVGKTDLEMPWASTDGIEYRKDDFEVMESGKERLHIVEMLHQSNGQVIWLDTSKVPMRDSSGQVIGIVGVSNDISMLKKAEQTLKESENKFRQIFDLSPIGIVLTGLDKKFLNCNQVFAKMFGYSIEEIVRLSVNEVTFPEDILVGMSEMKALIEGEVETIHIRKRCVRKDKQLIWVDLTISLIRDNENNPLYYLTNIQDITKHKETEEERDLIIAIIEQSSDFIGTSDMQGNLLYHNQAAKVILGMSADTSLIGMQIKDICAKRFLDLVLNKGIPTAIRAGKWQSEIALKHFDGHEIPVSILQMVHKDKDGIPAYTSSVMRDITENKQAEKVLNNLIEKNPMSIQIMDKDGFTLKVNPAHILLFGSAAPPNFSIFSDLQKKGFGEYILLAKNGEVVHFPDSYYNVHDSFPELPDKPVWVSAVLFPLTDKDGIIERFVFIHKDITERKQKEEALAKSENMLQTVLDNFPGVVFWKDRQSNYLGCNQTLATTVGLNSPAEIVGKTDHEMPWTSTETIDYLKDDMAVMESGKARLHIIEKLRQSDGQVKWIDTSKLPMRDSSGQVIGIIGVSNDISTLKMAEQELIDRNKELFYQNEEKERRAEELLLANKELSFQNEEKEKRADELIIAKGKAEEMVSLKTNFLANMSHEIRTPLSGILGFVSFLKDDLVDPSHLEYVNIIEKSGKRLLKTLNLILEFSKLEAEKEVLHYSNVCVNDIIEEVISTLKSASMKKNLYIRLINKDENLMTHIDERFLYEIMNNLLNNAIIYTKEGGITIELSKEVSDVVIKITDTGIGIAKENYDVIFEEFRQASEGYSRTFEGTGLGLSITKRFVKLMNGTIEVESKVGAGSTFKVKLPIVRIPDNVTIKIIKEEPKAGLLKPTLTEKDKLSILLVENDIVMIELTRKFIKDNYNLDIVVTGLDAIAKVKEKMYDVILMDINLGKAMTGLEASREIRKIQGCENIPVVALTAYVLNGDREEFLASGCTHYLGKPFTKDDLLGLIQEIAGNRLC